MNVNVVCRHYLVTGCAGYRAWESWDVTEECASSAATEVRVLRTRIVWGFTTFAFATSALLRRLQVHTVWLSMVFAYVICASMNVGM